MIVEAKVGNDARKSEQFGEGSINLETFSRTTSESVSPHPMPPNKEFGSPPPYQHPQPTPSVSTNSALASTTSNTARTNHLEIVEGCCNVKGPWEIDSNLAIPSVILENQKWDLNDGPRPNLNIETKGNVSGDVILSGPTADLAIVRINVTHGNVKLKFVNKTKQRLQISCTVAHGNISLSLPSSFKGNFECTSIHGNVNYSDPVMRNLTQFSSIHGKRLGFLNSGPIPSGPEGATAFSDAPDDLKVEVKHGNLKIRYLEEDLVEDEAAKCLKKERRPRKGLFNMLFS